MSPRINLNIRQLLLLCVILALSSCFGTKPGYYKVDKFRISDLDSENINFISDALPNWFHTEYDETKKHNSITTASKFIFFRDSLFVSIKAHNSPNGILTFLGHYHYENDSTIEIIYNDGNVAPIINLNYNDLNPNAITINLKDSDKSSSLGIFVETLTWSWIVNDSLILNDGPVRPEFINDMTQYVRARTELIDSLEWSKQVDDVWPDIIMLSKHPRTLFHPIPPTAANRDSTFYPRLDYLINIKQPLQNYLNVNIDKENSSVNYPLNNLSIQLTSKSFRWYPNRVRFKIKNDRLILLNNDGSESSVISIIYK